MKQEEEDKRQIKPNIWFKGQNVKEAGIYKIPYLKKKGRNSGSINWEHQI